MSELNRLTLEESMIVLACLNFVQDNANNDNALEVANDIQNVIEKIKPVVETKIAERKKFADIINASLLDVDDIAETIVRNPDVETPEYK